MAYCSSCKKHFDSKPDQLSISVFGACAQCRRNLGKKQVHVPVYPVPEDHGLPKQKVLSKFTQKHKPVPGTQYAANGRLKGVCYKCEGVTDKPTHTMCKECRGGQMRDLLIQWRKDNGYTS